MSEAMFIDENNLEWETEDYDNLQGRLVL